MISFLPELADTGRIGTVRQHAAGKELIMIRKTSRTLGAHPDLNQLKRQAKELLAALRAGDPDASAEFRMHYGRTAEEPMALHHAQLVLARGYGFESWPKLKTFVDGANVERLAEAVQAGDMDRVRALLDARPELVNMDRACRDEHRALHYAVLQRHTSMVRLLMERGADAHIGIYPHRDATRAITIATERGYDEIVSIIRKEEQKRASLSARAAADAPGPALSNAGKEAATAVVAGNLEWLRTQQAEGKLRNEITEVGGLLSLAVQANEPEALEFLLEIGMDPEERSPAELRGEAEENYWGNPLRYSVDLGRHRLAEQLLAHGADPNGTPMFTAYRNRDSAMLDILKRHGGVEHAAIAAYHRDIALARQLIAQEDAGTLAPTAVARGRTVSEELLDGDCGDPELTRIALARIDWAPDSPRWYGVLKGPTAFWNHIPWIISPKWPFDRDGYLACFRLVLERCHANVRGTFGRSILHDVITMGRRDGQPQWITEDEVAAFVAALLDAGADMTVRDDLLRSTPLGWACRWGRPAVVKLLLERGADAVEADAEGWATARAWAERMHHEDILVLLRQHTARHW